MLYQDNVAIVDEHLAGEEDQSLHRFTECIGEANMAGNRRRQLGCRSKIGDGHGCCIRCNDANDARSQKDHQERSAQPNQSF